MLVPVYRITIHDEELGLITYNPFATKEFDLREFLLRNVSGFVIAVSLQPQMKEVPDWIVPNDIDFVDIGDKRTIETGESE